MTDIAAQEFAKAMQNNVISPEIRIHEPPMPREIAVPPSVVSDAKENFGTPSQTLWQKAQYWSQKSWIWGLGTFLLMFVFLYCLNPPIVQQTGPNCNDQAGAIPRPPPNFYLVLTYSLVAGVAVALTPLLARYIGNK
jgi:hypothetical protein